MAVNCVFQGTLVDPRQVDELPNWLATRLTGDYGAVSFASVEEARSTFANAAEVAPSLSVNIQIQTLPGPRAKVVKQFLCHNGKIYDLPINVEPFPLRTYDTESVSDLIAKLAAAEEIEEEETEQVEEPFFDLEEIDRFE